MGSISSLYLKGEANFRGLLEAAPDAMIICDREGKIHLVNAQAEKIFGYTREQILGERIEILVPEQLRERHVGQRAEYDRDPHVRPMGAGSDLKARRKDGTEFPVEISLSPIQTEEGMLVIAAIRDVTDSRRYEQELKRLNEDLKKRQLLLEEANKELESFSYSVSHDLRAPLRHVVGFSDLLKQEAAGRLSETGQHYLQTIVDSTRQMGELIDDLLSFSRMGRTEMTESPVSIGPLVQEVIRNLTREADGRRIRWKIDSLPVVHADYAMLKLVFTNLISNALKYTRPREEAVIEIGSDPGDPKEHICYVRDNGVGFDMQFVDRLFGVFQRLHSVSEFEGTGIGLANVRRIIQRHGGRTWAKGEKDKGATFYFSLPAVGEGVSNARA